MGLIQVIMLLFLLLPFVESSCLGIEGFYLCQSNDTSEVPATATGLAVKLGGSALGSALKSMENLTELINLELYDGIFSTIQSSDFAAFHKLKKLKIARTGYNLSDVPPLTGLNFTDGLESLEDLEIEGYNLGASIASANFDAIPSLKALKLQVCNLYEFPITGIISHIQTLELSNNPNLDLNSLKYETFSNLSTLRLGDYRHGDPVNISTIKILPNTLEGLKIRVKQPLNAQDLIHLTRLRSLQVASTVDFTFSTFSTMPSLTFLHLDYLNNTPSNITLTINNCPAGLSEMRITAKAKDFRLVDNNCSADLDLTMINHLPCNCELYYKLKLKTGTLRYSCQRKLAYRECLDIPIIPSTTTTTSKSPTTSSGDSNHMFHWITMFLALITVFKMMP